MRILFLGFLLLLPAITLADKSLFREPGAAYLEDVYSKPLKIKVLKPAPIYFDAGLTRNLGVLSIGQAVEVQAVLDDNLRVVGKASQGQVSGWLPASYLEALEPDFVEKLKKAAARKTQIDALIQKNEVAMGMTADEVIKSLGKPPKTKQRQDATGETETWEYVRYERVPQQTTGYDVAGRYVNNVVYVKVPTGKLIVSFENRVVSAVEQTEGATTGNGRVSIVLPPVFVR